MSRGQKVAAEIELIRAALAEEGDRLQKLPKQATWIIHRHNGKPYRLTYQPAPISAWALHPPDSEASYLLGVIDRVLHESSSAHQDETVYRQQLHPWCIIQQLPQMQHRVVARFRRRNDADAHMRVLRQDNPPTQYTIIFDPVLEQTDVAAEA
ncbi:MAG: hypothetical protein F6J97_23465 [Leptolyngbya sp. SIO4C1]|nr:hypothetical protein [Leptolyngbya sp. SIO4C1]